MPVTAHTRAFAVLGQPVRHSLSPVMHNAALAALGLDAVYLALEVAPDRLPAALAGLAALGFGGVNCTIPHKEAAFRLVDRRDPSAELVGAVNTIQFTPEGTVGHNTDGYGVQESLRESFGLDIKGRRFFLVGSGGAGRGIFLHLVNSGAQSVFMWNRTRNRFPPLQQDLKKLQTSSQTEFFSSWEPDVIQRIREAEVIIQCTPVGMKPGDESPVPADAFHPGQSLLDTIYVSAETPTMRAARAAGARAVNGLGMLLHQGARALEIWTGRPAPVEVMRRALEQRLA